MTYEGIEMAVDSRHEEIMDAIQDNGGTATLSQISDSLDIGRHRVYPKAKYLYNHGIIIDISDSKEFVFKVSEDYLPNKEG